MSNQQIRDEVITLLVAGHETSASALTWLWYELSQHPTVEARLHAELDEVLGGRLPTVDDLPRLLYTRRVIDETLRLYPPGWVLMRNTLQDDEIGEYRVPAKTFILFSPYLVHRHPAFWENADDFDPDRFLPEQVTQRPRYAYIPFGNGPRICIGQSFALLEITLLVATVAQRYRLTLMPGHRMEQETLLTLRAGNGLPMYLQRRSPANGYHDQG